MYTKLFVSFFDMCLDISLFSVWNLSTLYTVTSRNVSSFLLTLCVNLMHFVYNLCLLSLVEAVWFRIQLYTS